MTCCTSERKSERSGQREQHRRKKNKKKNMKNTNHNMNQNKNMERGRGKRRGKRTNSFSSPLSAFSCAFQTAARDLGDSPLVGDQEEGLGDELIEALPAPPSIACRGGVEPAEPANGLFESDDFKVAAAPRPAGL